MLSKILNKVYNFNVKICQIQLSNYINKNLKIFNINILINICLPLIYKYDYKK